MFDLERAIADWRRRMESAGVRNPEVLDELESHLRQDFERRPAAGLSEAEAFQTASLSLGTSAEIQTEFKKLKARPVYVPVMLGIWIFLLVWLAAYLATIPIGGHARAVLIRFHIFFLTTGYGTAFVAGGIGAAYILSRQFWEPSVGRTYWLARSALFYAAVATVFSAVGVTLGRLWAAETFGIPLVTLKFIGSWSVVAWGIAVLALRRFKRASDHQTLLFCNAGNIIVWLAWFGAGMASASAGIRLSIGWVLEALLAAYVAVLALGFAPPRNRAQNPRVS